MTKLVKIYEELSQVLGKMKFKAPVTHVYNPIEYARGPHNSYLKKFGKGPKRYLWLGMNPGPFGMSQTGVPFGDVAMVQDYLQIKGRVGQPSPMHEKRPILGFKCSRSEVSGTRLWGFIHEYFGEAEEFFKEHIIINYCPLVFLEETGKNRTPDKLAKNERARLEKACDAALNQTVKLLQPEMIIGVGKWAEKRAKVALDDFSGDIVSVLHPSPASPIANRGFAPILTQQLHELGLKPLA